MIDLYIELRMNALSINFCVVTYLKHFKQQQLRMAVVFLICGCAS